MKVCKSVVRSVALTLGLAIVSCSNANADFTKTKNFKLVSDLIANKKAGENPSEDQLAKELLEEYQEAASQLKLDDGYTSDQSLAQETKAHRFIVKTLKRISKGKKEKPFPEVLASDQIELANGVQLKEELLKILNKILKKEEKDEEASRVIKKPCITPSTSAHVETLPVEVNKITHFENSPSEDSKSEEFYLLLKNSTGNETYPRNFRTTLKPKAVLEDFEQRPELSLTDVSQLRSLNVSGSAQPAKNELLFLAENDYKNKNVVVVDLRLESHVLVNGHPYSKHNNYNSLNWGKTQQQIVQEEQEYAKQLDQLETIEFAIAPKKEPGKKKPPNVKEWVITKGTVAKEKVLTEEETVEEVNRVLNERSSSTRYEYKRIANPDLHRPRDTQVEELVRFVLDKKNESKKSEKEVVFHFHCKAGRGRTTTAMAMVDIMMNYDKTNIEDILKRQHSLGGVNLNKGEKKVKPGEAGQWSLERTAFLRQFFRYSQEAGKDGFKMKWSEWIELHPEAKAQTNH